MTGRLKTTVAVFGIALRNRSLLRLELACSAFCAAEWGVWVSLVVYAYARGGATGAIALAIAVDAPSVVVAVTRAQLYTLDKGPFVFAVTGHPASGRAAGEMVTRRLDELASPWSFAIAGGRRSVVGHVHGSPLRAEGERSAAA